MNHLNSIGNPPLIPISDFKFRQPDKNWILNLDKSSKNYKMDNPMEPASTEFEQYMLGKSMLGKYIDTEMVPFDETLLGKYMLEKYICAETDPSNLTSFKGEERMSTFYNLKFTCCDGGEMLSGYREFIKKNRSRFPEADEILEGFQNYFEVLVLDQSGKTLARMFYAEEFDGVYPDWEKGKFFDEARCVSLMGDNIEVVNISNSKINIIFIDDIYEVLDMTYDWIETIFAGIKGLEPRMVRFKWLCWCDGSPKEFKELISKLGFPCHIDCGVCNIPNSADCTARSRKFFKEHNREANVALCDEFKKDIRTAYDQMSLYDLRTKPYLDLPQDVKNILVHIKAPDMLIERDFCLAKIATRNAEYMKALKIYNNIPNKVKSQYLIKHKGKLVDDIPQLKWKIIKRVCIECISMLLSLEIKNCSYANLVERYTYAYQYISFTDPIQHTDYDVNIFLRLLGKQDGVELPGKINALAITWEALYEQVPDHIDRILVDIIGRLKHNEKLNFYLPGDYVGWSARVPRVLNVPDPVRIMSSHRLTINFFQGVLEKQYRNSPSELKQSDGNSNLKQERFQQLESQMVGMKRTLDDMQRMMKNVVDKISNSPQPSNQPPKKRLRLNGER